MKFTTFIPLNHNDGSPFPASEIQEIISRIWETFHGATNEGIVEGHWVDDGKHYQDTSIKITVVCDISRLQEAEELVRDLGKQLDQLAMYFEIQYADGVRFLRID